MASAGFLVLALALLWAFRRQPQRLRYGAVPFEPARNAGKE